MTPIGTRKSVFGALKLCCLLLPAAACADDAEIYRCLQPDGSTAFQGMPCPEISNVEATEDLPVENVAEQLSEDAFVNPFDQPLESDDAEPADTLSQPPSQDQVACEDSARRAIDAIDAELAANQDEDAKSRLDELMDLTRQLRACKAL